MTMNPLPPQAYTKETLLRAYHWLQNQPDSIKEMALTPDILVSLFLKASREGDHVLERPSIQNFKTELKNLAGLMGELESPQTASLLPPMPTPPPAAAPRPTEPAAPPPPGSSTFSEAEPQPIQQAPGDLVTHGGLDANTHECLRVTRELFNLSSENEALRMLVKIGFENAKTLIPDPLRES